jgi:hypothetical protein
MYISVPMTHDDAALLRTTRSEEPLWQGMLAFRGHRERNHT